MGCVPSKKNQNNKNDNTNKTISVSGKSQAAPPSVVPAVPPKEEIPAGVEVQQYKKVFLRFTYTMDLIGDTSRLPQRTLQFVDKLFEAKKRVDISFENMEKLDENDQNRFLFKLFTKFHKPINDIIACLLNDKAFNEAFPIIRETFKEIYHNFREYSIELTQLLQQNQNPKQNEQVKEISKNGQSNKASQFLDKQSSTQNLHKDSNTKTASP